MNVKVIIKSESVRQQTLSLPPLLFVLPFRGKVKAANMKVKVKSRNLKVEVIKK